MSKVSFKKIEAQTQGHIFSSNRISDSNPNAHFITTTLEFQLFKSKHYVIAFILYN